MFGERPNFYHSFVHRISLAIHHHYDRRRGLVDIDALGCSDGNIPWPFLREPCHTDHCDGSASKSRATLDNRNIKNHFLVHWALWTGTEVLSTVPFCWQIQTNIVVRTQTQRHDLWVVHVCTNCRHIQLFWSYSYRQEAKRGGNWRSLRKAFD